MRKPFDKNLYDENDRITRDAVKAWLKENIIEDIETYGPDLFLRYGDTFIEVERKHSWNRKEFGFDTVQIPERKRKYLETGKKIVFFVVSKDLSQAIIVDGNELKNDFLREVSNRYVENGELFYCVPIERCEIVELITDKQRIDYLKLKGWLE